MPVCPTRRAPPAAGQLVPPLLAWFSAHARDLPWRRTRDPYAIWVSEIMLQQTQVRTVLPYWKRWMQEMPDVVALAKARPGRIHKLWEGLGYYSRVRNLQKAARILVEKHNGRFPRRFDEILALPGVGRYTAGAVCSIAYNQPTPILDGNVTRVLARLFGVAGNPRDKNVNARLWQLASELVHRAVSNSPAAGAPDQQTAKRLSTARSRTTGRDSYGCSHLNQSLMELGALICLPRHPHCVRCPVAAHCVALQQGCVAELPTPVPRTATVRRRFIAFVVGQRGRWLVRQRPDGIVNAHLWEFPNIEVKNSSTDPRLAARLALGVAPTRLRQLCRLQHTIMHYRIALEALRAEFKPPAEELKGRWFTRPQLRQLAFTAAHKKILNRL